MLYQMDATQFYGIYMILAFLINLSITLYSFICLINVILRSPEISEISERNKIARIIFALTNPPSQWLKQKFPGIVFKRKNGQNVEFYPLILAMISASIGLFIQYLTALPLPYLRK